ncbi:MAG: hypothetical protein QOI59_5877 [Gammaproteobacteria bacterium]|jgi:hypothetical protein|nr:hypothetical protein [Gammaproteobacteria bacterium]
MRTLVISISLPSSDTAPLPSRAACAIASMTRAAFQISPGVDVNTRLTN